MKIFISHPTRRPDDLRLAANLEEALTAEGHQVLSSKESEFFDKFEGMSKADVWVGVTTPSDALATATKACIRLIRRDVKPREKILKSLEASADSSDPHGIDLQVVLECGWAYGLGKVIVTVSPTPLPEELQPLVLAHADDVGKLVQILRDVEKINMDSEPFVQSSLFREIRDKFMSLETV